MDSRGDQLAAVYVAVHLLLMVVMALPERASEKEWERAQPWFQAWSGTASAVSVEVTPERVEQVFRMGNGLVGGIGQAFSPVTGPMDRYLGLDQSWGMFSSVPKRSAKLEVLVLVDDGWKLLFKARSDKHTWNRTQLDHERFRTYVNNFAWRRNRKEFRLFSSWLSDRVRVEHPDVLNVRIQMREVEFLPPEELRAMGQLPRGEAYWAEDDR